ncbi:MAG TPA: lysophospholipid acyltransferase family protein [Candidatus Krumholzibacteria bacterium]|nr:lysophospholipid acyltransferase family protein [Candidatus Krumholzibacteria bacterium]
MRARKRIKRAGEVALIGGLSALARVLPQRTGRALFARLGRTAGRIATRDHRQAVENLGLAFPDAPLPVRRALADAMFRQLGRNAHEFLRLEGASRDVIVSRVSRVEGMDHFLGPYRRGKGVIVITGHIGCWELLPAYFAAIGYGVTVVGRRMRVTRLDQRLLSLRRGLGVTSLDRDDNPRPMFDLLARGELLGVLIDQHTRVAGAWVPFFGRPAHTPTAVAKLAMATGAAIVPMGIFLEHDGRHVVRVMPELAVVPGGDRDADVKRITAEASQAVEELIRLDPAQWVWFHRRWREPEPGERVEAYAVEG